MKQFIPRAVIAIFVLCGFMFINQTCSAAHAKAAYASYPYYYGYGQEMYINPAIGTQAPQHPITPTQMRTGYTRDQIRSMPVVSRPNRPGHFIGNTVRRRNSSH